MDSVSFWLTSQPWQLGRANFPAGWEALEQIAGITDSRDVTADGCDTCLWMCVPGDTGLGCGPCCRVQAGPDLPAGGKMLVLTLHN